MNLAVELEGKGLFGWGGRLVIQPDIPVNNSMFDRVIDSDSKSFGPILVINSTLWYTTDKLISRESCHEPSGTFT